MTTGSVVEPYAIPERFTNSSIYTFIADGLTPIRRWGQPDDIGRAVAMLARGDLPFSTGDTINVDGGFHMRKM